MLKIFTGGYNVTIETGTLLGAGTDSAVILTLNGTTGSGLHLFGGVGPQFDSGR